MATQLVVRSPLHQRVAGQVSEREIEMATERYGKRERKQEITFQSIRYFSTAESMATPMSWSPQSILTGLQGAAETLNIEEQV